MMNADEAPAERGVSMPAHHSEGEPTVESTAIEPPPGPPTAPTNSKVIPSDANIGISGYANDAAGIHGILKHRFYESRIVIHTRRFSDFLVNEVDSEDNVVHLTNFDTNVPVRLSCPHASSDIFRTDRREQLLASLIPSPSSQGLTS